MTGNIVRYAAIKYNDIVDCDTGICVSYWCQGCPYHCEGCHNENTWDFNGGIERKLDDIINEIIESISVNNVPRSFSVLGGEPLCSQNLPSVKEIVKAVRQAYQNIKIFLWTGSNIENLKEDAIDMLSKYVDIVIDGPFIISQRDITLKMRGSSNQRIFKNIHGVFVDVTASYN